MFLLANIIQDAFGPLITLFASVLVFLHKNVVGGSWGMAIVALTALVRAILLPLTIKQLRSMQNMQRMAPQIKALQAKYKDDKQRQNEEMMKFYRENNVNPFASCIPLLLQAPVFISLFYALRENLKIDICGPQLLRHFSSVHQTLTKASQIPGAKLQNVTCNSVPGGHGLAKFLFIPDITARATGAVLIVLLVLYVGSQVASTAMMSASADKNQRRLMMFLPFFFVLLIFRFPAGVLVYWITTNLWTLAQQYVIRRRMGPPPAPAAKATTSDNGSPLGARAPEPALAGVASGGSVPGRTGAAPPPPPRRKKKRSGRRR